MLVSESAVRNTFLPEKYDQHSSRQINNRNTGKANSTAFIEDAPPQGADSQTNREYAQGQVPVTPIGARGSGIFGVNGTEGSGMASRFLFDRHARTQRSSVYSDSDGSIRLHAAVYDGQWVLHPGRRANCPRRTHTAALARTGASAHDHGFRRRHTDRRYRVCSGSGGTGVFRFTGMGSRCFPGRRSGVHVG